MVSGALHSGRARKTWIERLCRSCDTRAPQAARRCFALGKSGKSYAVRFRNLTTWNGPIFSQTPPKRMNDNFPCTMVTKTTFLLIYVIRVSGGFRCLRFKFACSNVIDRFRVPGDSITVTCSSRILIGGHDSPLKRVTETSPSQKGHQQENCQLSWTSVHHQLAITYPPQHSFYDTNPWQTLKTCTHLTENSSKTLPYNFPSIFDILPEYNDPHLNNSLLSTLPYTPPKKKKNTIYYHRFLPPPVHSAIGFVRLNPHQETRKPSASPKLNRA